jgi:hypothetical protein
MRGQVEHRTALFWRVVLQSDDGEVMAAAGHDPAPTIDRYHSLAEQYLARVRTVMNSRACVRWNTRPHSLTFLFFESAALYHRDISEGDRTIR